MRFNGCEWGPPAFAELLARTVCRPACLPAGFGPAAGRAPREHRAAQVGQGGAICQHPDGWHHVGRDADGGGKKEHGGGAAHDGRGAPASPPARPRPPPPRPPAVPAPGGHTGVPLEYSSVLLLGGGWGVCWWWCTGFGPPTPTHKPHACRPAWPPPGPRPAQVQAAATWAQSNLSVYQQQEAGLRAAVAAKRGEVDAYRRHALATAAAAP